MITFEVNQRTFLASSTNKSITIYNQDFDVVVNMNWDELSIPIIYDQEIKFVQSGLKTTNFMVHADGNIYTVRFEPTSGKI